MPRLPDPFTPPPPPPSDAGAGAAPLLPSVSIVEQAMAEARRVLGWVLAGLMLLLGALLAERWLSDTARQAAAWRHGQAQQVAGALRLTDLQLTTTAQMAVITGQPEWVAAFDGHRPVLEQLLAQARALAPAEAIARFEAASGSATVELEDMRESAFEAVSVGAPDVARQIFEGERYRHRTEALQRAIAEFSAATVAAAQADIEATARRSAAVAAVLVVCGALLGAALWRRLTRSRGRFADAEHRVRHLASSDLLTGLPNRTAMHDAMAAAMARAKRSGSRLAVLMLDLDGFKPVNDRHGHAVGDRVLKEAARRLRSVLRADETCARYGGDEFVAIVTDDADPCAAHRVAERALQLLSAPVQVGELSLRIGASVGIARYPDDGQDADELLRKADSALYRAKAQHRGGLCHYDAGLDGLVAERASLEQALREGLARGEFRAHFQPIVDLASGRVHGVEMLARWMHPERGLLPPALFIPLAEASGQIGALMLAVLEHACSELARLPAAWRLSVNVSPHQIQDEALVPALLAVLARHGVPPRRVDLELTETALVHDTTAARRVMRAMKAAGFTVSLDDFGTGHSSLAYLAEMDFDTIKIDRSFVHTLRERPQSAKVVASIIGLSRSLGAQTVAEGIETEADAARLRQMGCTLGQGYLYGRPVPAAELSAPADRGTPARPAEQGTPAQPAVA